MNVIGYVRITKFSFINLTPHYSIPCPADSRFILFGHIVGSACADTESFVRGGPTLTVVLVFF